jgi:sterol desaturase/sphingolipid hydroxylase (fatty acid hydroxylase superfamily)
VHHSPDRLYVLNAGRVHTLEKVLYLIPEVVPFVLLGTNIECLALYVTFNSIQGSFQHSNVNVRLGPLNYFFSMAELHRWHHSKIVAESDHNFGNNLLVWDWVFGTWYLPRGRKVSHLGLLSGDYPQAFFRQSVRHAIYPPGAAESTGPPVAFTRKPGNLVRSQ